MQELAKQHAKMNPIAQEGTSGNLAPPATTLVSMVRRTESVKTLRRVQIALVFLAFTPDRRVPCPVMEYAWRVAVSTVIVVPRLETVLARMATHTRWHWQRTKVALGTDLQTAVSTRLAVPCTEGTHAALQRQPERSANQDTLGARAVVTVLKGLGVTNIRIAFAMQMEILTP